jgi:tetratricopeptide (TPR) repeat protein
MLPSGKSGETDGSHAATARLVDLFQRALQRRNRQEIADRLRGLVLARAPMAERWFPLAVTAVDLGEITLGRQAIELYIESCQGQPAAHFRKVDFLAYFGAFDEALALLRTLPATNPDPFAYALSRGTAALKSGEAREAREWLGEAADMRPDSGSAWQPLAQLVNFAEEPELAERLLASQSAMANAPAQERALYHYALGKLHADRADPAAAFGAFAQAASETRALYPYDRAEDRSVAVEAISGYDADRIAELASRQSERTDRSIFVMGLPRSGTTLVEQILTSHSEVSDGAEIDLLRLLVHETGNPSFPALSAFARRAGVAPLSSLWRHLLDERFPRPGRVVDKTTDTPWKLGIAAAVLPQAPLIWLTRDPLDCAWSCFRNCFLRGIRWSNALEDIAYHFRIHDSLLTHWQRYLGDRLLVVPYESLVGDPAAWTRRILAHCGLAEEPQVFSPQENSRVVATASAMQVRRPINRQAIGSAEPYRQFLQPFIDAYPSAEGR